MSENRISLPMDVRKQRALLGHCILSPVFFQQCKVRVESDWFGTAPLSSVYKAVAAFWDTYKRLPTVDELTGSRDIAQYAAAERATLVDTINSAIAETENFGVDTLKNELTYWLGSRIYKLGVAESERAYNSGDFDKCYQLISQRVKELNESKFVEDIAEDFSDPISFFKQVEQRYDDAITFGVKELDDAMVPPGTDSGPRGQSKSLLLGDTTLILAPANAGKTSMLITVARHNIVRGKDVLWFSHEGVNTDLHSKMIQSVLGVDQKTIFELMKTEDGRSIVINASALITQHLVYIPYNFPGMTVEEFTPVIERRQEEWRAKHKGKGFDLLVDDYPAKLRTVAALGGRLEQRNADSLVYDQFTQLALKHKFHALLAIQTNREGSKVNRDESRLLTMEDVRESWDCMTMATNVITINRDAKAASRNRVTFYVAKSRSSRTGRAIVCSSDYEASVTHSDKLGATYYYGTMSLSDHIDEYLTRFRGREISEEAVQEAL